MKENKKNKRWCYPRHGIVRNILFAILSPVARIKYGVRIERFKEQGDRQYLILFNHQTAFDQFFVGMCFRGPVYYVASEDLFSNGLVSSIIRYLVAPIPIKKQTTDVHAVINCMRVANEGGTIALAPEGNRTYSGKTEYMNPSISMLVRKLKLPIAFVRIEGGYGVQPRWSDVTRKGKMRTYVSRVIEPEEYVSLSNDEIYALVQKELFVDEARDDRTFLSKKSAEYLERAMYVCPHCGLSEFESHKDVIECKKCHVKVRYLASTALEGVDQPFPYPFVSDWYDAQCEFVNDFDTSAHTEEPLYRDTAQFSEVIVYKTKRVLDKKASIVLYGDRITVNEGSENAYTFSFADVTAVTVLGKNKVNIYHNKQVFQIKGSKRFNALRYVNLCYRHKNILKGEYDGSFLGL